jgi:hypothetical protein
MRPEGLHHDRSDQIMDQPQVITRDTMRSKNQFKINKQDKSNPFKSIHDNTTHLNGPPQPTPYSNTRSNRHH